MPIFYLIIWMTAEPWHWSQMFLRLLGVLILSLCPCGHVSFPSACLDDLILPCASYKFAFSHCCDPWVWTGSCPNLLVAAPLEAVTHYYGSSCHSEVNAYRTVRQSIAQGCLGLITLSFPDPFNRLKKDINVQSEVCVFSSVHQ